MKIIKRIFAPKEVKVTLNILDELSLELHSEAFRMIRSRIEEGILRDYKNVISQVKDGASARQLIYSSIANIAGDYVESGHYHVYRGVLSSEGIHFLELFDMSVDWLLKEGAISKKEAKEQKAGIKKNIECVG